MEQFIDGRLDRNCDLETEHQKEQSDHKAAAGVRKQARATTAAAEANVVSVAAAAAAAVNSIALLKKPPAAPAPKLKSERKNLRALTLGRLWTSGLRPVHLTRRACGFRLQKQEG